jgi:quinol monooxygenase YgiN
LSLASHERRTRLSGLLRRQDFLDRQWSDEAVFDAHVAKDRYFKLVDATLSMEEKVDRVIMQLSDDLQRTIAT